MQAGEDMGLHRRAESSLDRRTHDTCGSNGNWARRCKRALGSHDHVFWEKCKMEKIFENPRDKLQRRFGWPTK